MTHHVSSKSKTVDQKKNKKHNYTISWSLLDKDMTRDQSSKNKTLLWKQACPSVNAVITGPSVNAVIINIYW